MAKIRVPKDVLDGITAVRDSGLTNMLSIPDVIRLARRMGYEGSARWVETNRRSYAELVFLGAEADEGVIIDLHAGRIFREAATGQKAGR